MRTSTKTQNVYTYDELSDTAKEAVKQWINQDHFLGQDCMASLKAFAAHFGAKVTEWEYGAFDVANIETDAEPSNFRGFKLRDAKAIPEFLTGYCLDCTLREVFIKEFETSGDAFAAFIAAMDAGIKETRADWEYQFDDEVVCEICEANGCEFSEDGETI